MPVRGGKTVGDPAFLGINDRLKPESLKQGAAEFGRNTRFREGVCATRGGVFPIVGNQRQGVSWFPPLEDLPRGKTEGIIWPIRWDDTREPIGRILEVAPFEDPQSFASVVYIVFDSENFAAAVGVNEETGREFDLKREHLEDPDAFPRVDTIHAYRTRFSHRAQRIPIRGLLHPGWTFKLVPAFESLLLLTSGGHWFMDNFQEGFNPFKPSTDGYEDPPLVPYGIWSGNRLLIPDKDVIYTSNTLDPFNYHILGQLRINQGDSDDIVALHAFGNTAIVVFKESSIYLVSNFTGASTNLANAVNVSLLTKTYGILARESIANAGNALLFLSREGVHSIRLTPQNEIHASAVPLSGEIDKTMSRVNWAYADRAVGEIYSNKYYLSVPIDGEKENNVVLVYDLLTSTWQGYDQHGDKQKVRLFYKTDYGDIERLHSVDHESNVWIYDYGEWDYKLEDNEPNTKITPLENRRWLSTHRAVNIATDRQGGIEVLYQDEIDRADRTRLELASDIQEVLDIRDGITSSLSGSVSGSLSGYTSDSVYVYVEGNQAARVPELGVAAANIEAKKWQYIPIEVEFITREYRLQEEFRIVGLSMDVEIWDASYVVSVILNGREIEIKNYLKQKQRRDFNRRKYSIIRADYDLRNPNETFNLPSREDYSLTLHDDGTLIGGAQICEYTSYEDRRDISLYGRTIQVKVINDRGRVKVRRISVDLLPGERDKRIKR